MTQKIITSPGFLVSRRGGGLILLAWIAMLGFDFFLHGGLLAGLYARPTTFLLPPMEAFRRIPIGYLSFLVAAGFLVWILAAIDARGWQKGLAAGAAIGAAMWVSLALGLYSISTASPLLLAAWAGGQTLEMAYAGAVVGWAAQIQGLRRPFVAVILASLGFFILTVALQSVGLAPAGSTG